MSFARRRWMGPRTLVAAALCGVGMVGCRASSSPPVPPASPAAAAPRNAPGQMGKPYVVMLSADGYRHDYVDRWTLPAVDALQREGARAAGLVPSFPTKTFPNHYSIATGLYVGDHGLVGNEMWDPRWGARFLASRPADSGDARWFGGEPIWVTAERQGMLTATFFWPGSEAPIRGRRPTYWKAYDIAVPDSVRIDGMLGWLALPAAERPHLVLGYLSDVDDAAHKTGPVSPETHAAAEAIDVALARLRAGIARLPIRDSVNLILVSDHGLTEVRATEYLSRYTAMADTTAVVTAAAYAQLFFGGNTAAAERAYTELQRMPHARVWRRRDIPRRFHLRTNPRAGDVFVLMEPPYRVERTPPATPPTGVGGTHGYDPRHPDMPGIFFAVGPAIRPGVRVGPVENVNVHPFIAHLLGIQPAAGIDGRLEALRPILR
ncbi:MAG TPA: alkaline phosphatase family protein [Longimicrobiaceae bacterium]|nr:alkaline phosphatase family protein [Longimicrobiaceae bacterium]